MTFDEYPKPSSIYIDKGSKFDSEDLERLVASLGLKLYVKLSPQPSHEAQIERFFGSVNNQIGGELGNPDSGNE